MPYADPKYELIYRQSHREKARLYGIEYRKKHFKRLNHQKGLLYDWLHLQLGNKCNWCERTAQETDLEVDHVLPEIRLKKITYNPLTKLIHQYDSGVELQLLCTECHRIRHVI